MIKESKELNKTIMFFKSIYIPTIESLASILLGFIIGGIMVYASGFDPLLFYKGIFFGAFGSSMTILNTLSYMTPLILTGLSFAIAARASLFNIGAEGQLYVGALTAVITGAYLSLPIVLHPIVIIIISIVASGLYGALAGWLKVFRGVNEVVSTIMLNWIAFYSINYLATYIFYNPKAPYQTINIRSTAVIPLIYSGTTFSYTFFISLAFAILAYIILWRTSLGYNIRAVGLNPSASEYGGINVKKIVIISMFLSGGTAGLAGSLEVLGRFGNIDIGLSDVTNLGFDGIAVSIMGRNNPLGIIFSALLFAMLRTGLLATQLYTSVGGKAGVPLELSLAVEGVIIIFASIPGLLQMIRNLIKKRRQK